MATAVETFTPHDRSSVHSTSAKSNHEFFTHQTNTSRVGHCLDDADILTLKRQYANFNFFEQSILSSSADDLSQFDRLPYPPGIFVQDPNDIDDDELPYDDAGADYFITIQERLKKANDEFQQDQTPAKPSREPRITFDATVKAVDIILEPADHDDADQPSSSSAGEASPATTREYTVPLNDTQPKEGLSLVEQIKAIQFQNTPPMDNRWATTMNHANGDSAETRENTSPAMPVEDDHSSPKNSMVVSVNGRFDLQSEDDYIAKYSAKPNRDSPQKPLFLPTPPTEPKKKQDKPARPFLVRPKSSETTRKTDTNSSKKSKTDSTVRQRPKSAGVSKSIEAHVDKPSSGVDFDELLRKAATKKRAELREERRKKQEEDEKRQKELEMAKESYERWLEEKNSERKRINEEKRMEKEEEMTRHEEQGKELNELREKKFKEWLNRKAHEAMIASEFQKLKADEEELDGRRSAFLPNSSNSNGDHRAFRRWLRHKHEQELEEKHRLRLEAKQRRRRERRSIKRQQLQQDIQLAKSYGYS